MIIHHRAILLFLTIPIIVIVMMMVGGGCTKSGKPSEKSQSEFSRLRDEGLKALNRGNFDLAYSVGDSLLRFGMRNPKLTDASIYGNLIKGQASIFSDSLSLAYPYLHDAEALCLRNDNDFALASVYNGLGIYSANIEKDNNEALRYYFLGLDASKRSGNERLHALLLCNIASIYYLTEDPMGLRYALECYDHGKKIQDEFLHYIGSLSTAYSYLLREEYEPALKYIREAEMVLRRNDINNGATLYCLYGMILRRMGNREEAEDAFQQSIRYMNEPDAKDFDLRAFIEMAGMLRENNHMADAVRILESGLKVSDNGHDNIFRSDLLQALATTHRISGNEIKAKEFEEIRDNENSSVENREKEIAIEHIRAKYDLERVENELNRQQIELLEKQSTVYVLVTVLGLFLLLIGCFLYYYRRKNKLYKAIVANMTESAREEERLRETINRLEEELMMANVNDKKNAYDLQDPTVAESTQTTELPEEKPEIHSTKDAALTSSNMVATSDATSDFKVSEVICEEKNDKSTEVAEENADTDPEENNDNPAIPAELFHRLRMDFERLMADKSVYTDNLITKEKIVRRLGTNRTYFSRFINDCYKMSFTRLINSFRIKEAVRLLSDPDVSLPLKSISEQLGFNSQSTFYSQFQEATGMTPASFRNKACRLPKS